MNLLRVLMFVLCVPSIALAQVRILSQDEMRADALRSKVVTNGELGGHKDFELLLIGDNGAYLRMMQNAQTVELRAWVSRCEIIPMADNDARCLEHHQDLLRKHAELPILAMKDKAGGVWWSAGGSQIPSGEVGIAQALTAWAQATEAARRRGPVNQPAPMQKNLSQNYVDPGSYYLPRSGPQPFRPDSNSRRPLINPQVDVTVPDEFPQVQVEGSVDMDTRRAIYFTGGALVLCAAIIGFAILISASIMANAVTDEANDKTFGQQMQSVLPNAANAAQMFSR
jgi:hypothetical protein